MRYEIRAMSFAEILDMGFRLLRNHFVLIVGLAASLQVPLHLLQTWFTGGFGPRPTTWGPVVGGGFFLIAIVLVAPIIGAAVTFAVGETYVGRPPTIGQAIRRACGIVLPLTGTMLLIMVVVMGAGGVFLLPALVAYLVPGALPVGPPAALVVGIFVAMIVWVYVWLSFLVVTQVMVLEQQYGAAALRRSRTLMAGNRLRGAGITLLAGLIVGVIAGVLQLALAFVPVVGPIAVGVAQAATTAYTSAVLVVLYFDIRCRKEAFDLEHLATLVTGSREGAPALVGSTG